MHTVKVSLPINLNDQDRSLFEGYQNYSLNTLSVLHCHEVFVTYSGLCVNENGLMKECHHDYPEKYAELEREVAEYYRKAAADPDEVIELDDDQTYLIIHHPWSVNYWHWITEAVLRLWMVRNESKRMILLLPAHLRNYEFVESSLKPFHVKDVFVIPPGKSLLVRNLCLPQIKSIADSYYADALQNIRGLYLSLASQHPLPDIGCGEKVYISRRKSKKRKVENEEEVEALLRKFDFAIVYNEDYSFLEQVQLYSKVRYLISIHGAGMTNLLFMAPHSSLLELHKRKTNEDDWHSFAFWYMSDALGFTYLQQVCDPVNAEAHFFDADLKIDLTLLTENVRLLLTN